MERDKKYFALDTVLLAFVSFVLIIIAAEPAETSSLQRNVIKIGIASALKRSFGIAALRGAEMAAKEINDKGGVLGSKIQIIPGDTEGTAPKATEAIEKMYYSDKVDAIMGAYTSEEATAFQEQSAKFKINIFLKGTSETLDEKYKADPERYKYYWNFGASTLQITDYVLNHQYPLFINALKKQLGINKINVAVVSDMAMWTEALHAKTQDSIKARPDCTLVYTGRMSRDAVDFTAELTELRARNVQLILFSTAFSAGHAFVKQAYDLKLPAMITGSNVLAWSTSDFIKAIGIDAAAYNNSNCFNTLPVTPKTGKLLKEYERIYGGDPHQDVGNVYNAVKAYAKAIETAKSLNHEEVQNALKKIRLPQSEIWGSKEFSFDDTHRVVVSPINGIIMYTYQFKPTGDVCILDPAEYKTSDVLLPPWLVNHWKK